MKDSKYGVIVEQGLVDYTGNDNPAFTEYATRQDSDDESSEE